MHEDVVGSDNAYVTVEETAEELENLPKEHPGNGSLMTQVGGDLQLGETGTLIVKEDEADPDKRGVNLEQVTQVVIEESGSEQAPPKLDMNELTVQVIQALRQIHQSGDTFAAIVCNPSILEEFTAAFRSLPSEILPDHVREQLPIVPDPNIERLKIITGTDIELQFLQMRYGPRSDGGNGLIEDMKTALDRENSPVRVPTDFLRTIYLMELVDRVKPKIYTPSGADVLHQFSQPNLRR